MNWIVKEEYPLKQGLKLLEYTTYKGKVVS